MTNFTRNPKPRKSGGTHQCVNVTAGNLCCTLNTRYEDMATNDTMSLRHFPKTVVLIQFN